MNFLCVFVKNVCGLMLLCVLFRGYGTIVGKVAFAGCIVNSYLWLNIIYEDIKQMPSPSSSTEYASICTPLARRLLPL